MNIYFIYFKLFFKKEKLRQNSPCAVRGRCYEQTKPLTLLHTHTHTSNSRRDFGFGDLRTHTHTHTFWFCLISTCLRAMTMREMAWWHKCIHHGKISENWGHMLKHAESNISIPNLFATWTKVIPTLIFCMLWHCPLVSLRARCINIRAYCTML